jgi:hypothetical protein
MQTTELLILMLVVAASLAIACMRVGGDDAK